MSQLHNNLQHTLHPATEHTDLYPISDDKDLRKQKRKNMFYNRFIQPFQSLQFGSQAILFQVNNLDLLADTYLSLTFDVSGGSSTLRALPAMNALTRVDFIFSNSQQITLSATDMALFMLDSIEDTGKKEQVIALMGGNGGAISSATTYYLPLHFAWSHIRANSKKMPIDISQVGGPIKLFLYLNTATNVYSANAPNALSAGQLMIRQGQLSDASERISLGDKHLVYPHSFLQSFVSTPVTPATTTTNNTVYLSGFRSGDLLGMLVRSVDVSKLGQNNFQFNTLSFVVLRINGNIIAQYDFDSYKIQNLFHSNTATKVTLGGTDYWYIHFNFSHYAMKEKSFGLEGGQFGLNASNQLIQLDFQSSSTNAQVIQACYVYAGSLVIGGGSAEVVV